MFSGMLMGREKRLHWLLSGVNIAPWIRDLRWERNRMWSTKRIPAEKPYIWNNVIGRCNVQVFV